MNGDNDSSFQPENEDDSDELDPIGAESEPRGLKDRNVFQMAKRHLAPILGSGGSAPAALRRSGAFGQTGEVLRYPQAERRLGLGEEGSLIAEIELDAIQIGERQLREVAEDAELQNLADSIISKGVLQPIIIRPLFQMAESGARYELVAGERRYRAARLAGLNSISAIIQKLTDQEAVEVAIVENAQREDLNPVDEALAFRRLIDEFKMNQSEVARRVGKNRTTVANAVRLLNLHPDVIDLLKSGALTAGHGRALLMIDDYPTQIRLAERAANEGLSVRELESLASRYEELAGQPGREEIDLEEQKTTERLTRRVAEYLGIERVNLRLGRQGEKRVTLVFDTEASWKRFISKIKE